MNELGKSDEGVIMPAKPRDGSVLDDDVKKAMGIAGRVETPLVESFVEDEAPIVEDSADDKVKTDSEGDQID